MMKGKNGFSIYLLCHHSRNIDYFSTQTVNNMMVLGQIQLGLPFLSLSLSLSGYVLITLKLYNIKRFTLLLSRNKNTVALTLNIDISHFDGVRSVWQP